MHAPLRRAATLFACVAVAAAAACSSATGTVKGGEPAFDAAPPNVETPQLEGGAGGHTWTDLYRDYFGPTGVASCQGNGSCHGDPSQSGALTLPHFVCPAPQVPDAGVPETGASDAGGGDAATDAAADATSDASTTSDSGVSNALAEARTACLDSLKKTGLITPGTPPEQTGLYGVLRKDTGGSMPQNPPYKFNAGDLKRITDWIASGANND